jgi:hypothetical protein
MSIKMEGICPGCGTPIKYSFGDEDGQHRVWLTIRASHRADCAVIPIKIQVPVGTAKVEKPAIRDWPLGVCPGPGTLPPHYHPGCLIERDQSYFDALWQAYRAWGNRSAAKADDV